MVYGARLLTYLGDKISDARYWAGTLFPDIRHLGLVSRHRTHAQAVGLQNIIGKNDFETGMRAHAWVDATRETYWREQNMKETLPWHPFVPHALKLLEDELVYDSFQDWDNVRQTLDQIYEEELYYVDSKEHVRRWHDILQRYLAKRPDVDSRKRISTDIGLSENSAEEISLVVEKLRGDARTKQLIEQFQVHLEQLLA